VGVLLGVEGVGLVLVVVALAVSGESLPPRDAVLYALAAGACGVSALGLFYSALAVGTMSIAAPISASGAALPVLVGVISGDALSALVAAGLAVTMIGVILASLEATVEEEHHPTRRSRLSIALALGAALGFGGYFALSDPAADASVLWLLFFVRILGVPVLTVLLLARRTPLPAGRDRGLVAGAGVLDVSATGLYGVAQTLGALSVVSVVGALYPVTTVLLARGVLGERLRRVQAAGVVLALLGVALIAAG
jgi:drug/metabolite transporter (DMT)-like permease